MPRRPTADDVARAANVSRATVSYVLNDKPDHRIPARTVERVIAAARLLGYKPSVAARALKLGRSDVVLGLLPDWPIGYTVGSLLEALSTEFESFGLTFVAHPGTRSHEGWSPGLWRGVAPAGVVSFQPLRQAEREALAAEGIAIEVLFAGDDPDTDVYAGPFAETGRIQVEHVAAAGHRRLGVAYLDDHRIRAFADARLAGARSACQDLGLALPVVIRLPIDAARAAEAVASWRSKKPPVTAVCAYNDDLALAILAALDQLGLRAPQDLAVIGVEDIPAAAFAHPPLTSVASDRQQQARIVATRLLAKIHGLPPPPAPPSVRPRVIVRASA